MPAINIEEQGGALSIHGAEFDPDLVRSSLLLFDRLDSPANSLMQIGSEVPPRLEDWDGYQRSRVFVDGSLSKQIFPQVLLSAFQGLEDREEGRWAISRSAQGIGLPKAAFGAQTAFKIRLENALPMPDRSVSFEEVLSYKVRRRDELLSLRHHLDDLAIDAAKQGFGGFSETVAFEKFVKSLDQHCKSAREENFLKRNFSLDITFNWTDVIAKGLAAIPIGQMFPNLASAAFFMAVGTSVSVESAFGLQRRTEKPSPFDYLFKAGAEL